MAIVTISHEIGAGGPEIGQQLAERLGCRYVDHELISNAATRYGLLEEKLSHLDESKPSLFERFDAETRRYITVIQTALYDLAEQDNVVLMGRGGQWLLRGIPHVLRVRVMAPFDVRVKRLTKMLAGVVGQPELATTPASAQLVADRSLASRVQVALATHPETRKYRITVEARAGQVTLEGTAAMDEALDVARGVPGVRGVKAEQVDIPPIPPFVA